MPNNKNINCDEWLPMLCVWIQVFESMVLDPSIKNLTEIDPKIKKST